MKIEQIYTGCLAHGAYYIESNGEAAIIDPLREVQPYIDQAQKDGAQIKYVFETHFHADFVSGHIDLAHKTGAKIVYGPTEMETGFEKVVAKDRQEFKLGDVTITVLHTPGHTLESSCFLLADESGKDVALFTGDTLFIGDVGRPDLAQKVIAELTEEKLAAHLYDSLRNQIMPLNDDIIVYPAHGAGSACGKKMSKETTDTLGNQKQNNYALRPELTKEQFIKEVLTGLTPPPGYFPQNVLLNIKGYESLDTVMERSTQPLSPRAFEMLANETDALILDTRDPVEFYKGYIPNSINIGLDGSFASWVGTLIPDVKQPIIFISEIGREEEVITRLARVGYDHALGYLEGGFETWVMANKEIDRIEHVPVVSLHGKDNISIIDCRRESEYNTEHLIGAKNLPLDYINEIMSSIDREKPQYVYCKSGYRSVIFISILKARGFTNLINITGGFEEIKETNAFKLSEYQEQTTDL